MFTLKLLSSLVILATVLQLIEADDFCSLFGDNRICVPIRKCESVLKGISGSLLTTSIIRRLQKITCGFEQNDPKVCCPEAEMEKRDDGESSKINFHSRYNFLPAIEECGKSSITIKDYVIGGKTPAVGSFPWLARICYKEPGSPEFSYFCGGTLITKEFILTAAHCIFSLVAKRYSVQLGEHDTRVDPEISPELGMKSHLKNYGVAKILIHPHYNDTSKQNDIALIQLAENVVFTPFIKPLCLPYEKKYSVADLNFGFQEFDNPRSRPMADVAGFGKVSNDDGDEGSEILQYTQVPIISNKKCREIYTGRAAISSSQLCAGGEPGKDSCDGDSGGSLSAFDEKTKRYYQIAIVSFGPTICGSRGYPGIYTRIYHYLEWILSSITQAHTLN